MSRLSLFLFQALLISVGLMALVDTAWMNKSPTSTQLGYTAYVFPERKEQHLSNVWSALDQAAKTDGKTRAAHAKRALIAASEGRRQEQINIATGEREAAIARSEGEKQAQINQAQGEAAAVLAIAEATAKALTQVAEAVRQPGGMDAVNLKVAERFVDAFGNVAKEGNTLILPANLSDMGGMIAAAMNIVKQTK